MENVKVSVIMPVYGVEAYVGKAIESIQKQTYKNFDLNVTFLRGFLGIASGGSCRRQGLQIM